MRVYCGKMAAPVVELLASTVRAAPPPPQLRQAIGVMQRAQVKRALASLSPSLRHVLFASSRRETVVIAWNFAIDNRVTFCRPDGRRC
jgi:hypothetical protein